MLEQRLKSLNEAVNALDNPESLLLLNIDEGSLDAPDTTREYVARCRAWIQLRNITKSIPDLLGQHDSVALVGLLGHFSSGKSSLINALLEIPDTQNPGYKRDVGVHPTDTGITLITHQDHAQVVRKSAYTAIDAVEVVHGPALDFLEHIVLVDTPGLGNEAAEHETVTRFLHLCHVLVITIDGRRPFADKDKDFELLDTAFNKLGGVPKILVITSAEEFLTTRKGNFATDWQEAQAEAFWNEAIERLRRDPRFEKHLHRFKSAPRFFVDSKEGFRIEEVRNCLLPIVTDDTHRSRIRHAQGQYVLSTAAEALRVLLVYISTRSDNLNRLLTEAQERADGTATAVEELLRSLESSLQNVKQRLHEARQATPSGNFSLDAIITRQAINDSQGAILRKLEGEMRKSVEQQLNEVRELTWRRVRKYFKARTRDWFPTKKSLGLEALSEQKFEIDEHKGELAAVSTQCARTMLRTVNQQLGAAFAGALQHLRNRSEAWEMGSSVHGAELALERFQRVHDDSIKSFYAYISAPSSSDLLKEHGFVGFDESGNQAVQTEAINAVRAQGFVSVSQSADSCKDRLRSLGNEEPDDLRRALDDEEARSIEDTAFGETYCDGIGEHVNRTCHDSVGRFISNVTERIDEFAQKIAGERSDFAERKVRIWKARAKLLVRLILVAILLVGCGYAISELSGNYAEVLLSVVTENLLETVVAGAVSSIIVLALSYIVTGGKNEEVRQALRSVLVERWIFHRRRRDVGTTLKEYYDGSYEQLINEVGELPLEVDEAIANGIVTCLRKDTESYRDAETALAELWKVIDERSKLFDEFIEVVNQRLDEIPKELRETAERIKQDAIEKHMTRIRDAAASVEKVRSDVQHIADIAMESN